MTIKDLNVIGKEYLSERGFGKYFIHGIGHWLGLDVHDVGGRQTAIKTGSVFTIEPGIYISEDDTTADECYRGIGIRIEDVVLMTEDGYELMQLYGTKMLQVYLLEPGQIKLIFQLNGRCRN